MGRGVVLGILDNDAICSGLGSARAVFTGELHGDWCGDESKHGLLLSAVIDIVIMASSRRR